LEALAKVETSAQAGPWSHSFGCGFAAPSLGDLALFVKHHTGSNKQLAGSSKPA
jgi:hypothetical protein